MRVVLIEDEIPALEALERAARTCEPGLEVLARLGSIRDALQWFGQHSAPDLVFCDIMLNDGVSLAIFDKVKIAAPVIFCTAYDTYWPQALAQGGIDYLVKPIEVERLRLAFAKVAGLKRHFTQVQDLGQVWRDWQQQAAAPVYRSHLVVKRGLEYLSLPVTQIAYFLSEHKLVTLVDRQGRQFILDRPLNDLASELPPTDFFRAARNMLVAFSAIRSFRAATKGRLALAVEHAAQPVLVSQENARLFREWFER